MIDNIVMCRIWQDVEFFQITIECKNRKIVVNEEIYTTDAAVDDLYNKIGHFLSLSEKSVYWQNGTRGEKSPPCVGLRFIWKDNLGHILVEVFLEIADGGILERHNCCFYVETEIGALYQFMQNLQKLKTPELGIKVCLNEH